MYEEISRRWSVERFWMGGIQGENLQEIRSDLEAINEPGFWSIAGSFEGSWTLARFKDVAKMEFVSAGRDLRVGQWRSSKTRDEYMNYVEVIRSLIAAGEVYQVNACRILSAKILEEGNLSGLFSRILSQNPAPFAGYLSLPDVEIASASPERFLSKDGNRIISSPIKGTSATSEFLSKIELKT